MSIERDESGLRADYEYIEIDLSDKDCAKIEFIQNEKRESINVLGRGKIIIKRRKWS